MAICNYLAEANINLTSYWPTNCNLLLNKSQPGLICFDSNTLKIIFLLIFEANFPNFSKPDSARGTTSDSRLRESGCSNLLQKFKTTKRKYLFDFKKLPIHY